MLVYKCINLYLCDMQNISVEILSTSVLNNLLNGDEFVSWTSFNWQRILIRAMYMRKNNRNREKIRN